MCVSLCLIQMLGRTASTWGKVSAPGVRRSVYNNFVLFSFNLITWSILINTTILIKFVATWFHIHICRIISDPIQLPNALGRQYAPLVKLHSPSEVFSVRRHVWARTKNARSLDISSHSLLLDSIANNNHSIRVLWDEVDLRRGRPHQRDVRAPWNRARELSCVWRWLCLCKVSNKPLWSIWPPKWPYG